MSEEGLFLETGKPRYSGTSAPSTPAAMDRPSASSSSNERVGVAGSARTFAQRNSGVVLACLTYFSISLALCTQVLPVIDEDFSDVVYFTVVTLTTCGFGDVVPKTAAGRLFIIFYVFAGVILFSIVIGIVSVANLRRGLSTAAEARTAATRRFLLRFGSPRSRRRGSHKGGSGEESERLAASGEAQGSRGAEGSGVAAAAAAAADADDDDDDDDDSSPSSLLGRKAITLLLVVREALPFFVFTLLGALVVHLTNAEWSDDMTYVNSLYFTFTTGTTIGFGDIVPKDKRAKWFCVLYIPVSVFVIWRTVHNVSDIYIQNEIKEANAEILAQDLSFSDLLEMNDSGDGKVTEAEFTKGMLIAMNKVDKEVMAAIHQQFVALDPEGHGWLVAEHLKDFDRQVHAGGRDRTATVGGPYGGPYGKAMLVSEKSLQRQRTIQ
jgi:hypothetical protein